MANSSFYNKKFYDLLESGSYESAKNMVPIVLSMTGPVHSVLDVGCGIGTWLAAVKEEQALHNCECEITGVDGSYVDPSNLYISPDQFIPGDLTQPLDLGKKFDLVISLEVAEHIPQQFAQQFVESLCRHSDVILFSAAIPGQYGTNHVNTAFPSYWADLFEKCNYYPIDSIRNKIWENESIEYFYRQNVMFYASKCSSIYSKFYSSESSLVSGGGGGIIYHSSAPRPSLLDIVHPQQLKYLVDPISFTVLIKTILSLLAKVPKYFTSALVRKLKRNS